MKPLESSVIKFIKKHHVLTFATSNNNEPYCANCFYAYMEEENCLVFASEESTKHIQDALKQRLVAGSIVLETHIIGKIQGIQFNGQIFLPQDDFAQKAKHTYVKRFPFARLMNTTLWVIELTFIKMTDNYLGFGKKILWNKE